MNIVFNTHEKPAQTGDTIAIVPRNQGHIMPSPTLMILRTDKPIQIHSFTATAAQPRLTCPPRLQPIATRAPTHRSVFQMPPRLSTTEVTSKVSLAKRGYQFIGMCHQPGGRTQAKKTNKPFIFHTASSASDVLFNTCHPTRHSPPPC